ncbi:MAG TPA: succinate dehydrogenase cytochrome b subunit [Gemmatimonadales bacterium]|nr:succinate dehydrogenase cytochrome b subunit [Gemmatimonadales bacterium]
MSVTRLARFWHSTLGKKVVMGATGLIMVGFVIAHMLGNLQAFESAEKFNAYGAMLHGPLHEIVLALRVVLLVSVGLHIVAAWQLTVRGRAARPAGYARQAPQMSTLASRSIRLGGVVLLLFIPYHLLHFTTGDVHPDFIPGDVYHNLVTGLARPGVALFYIVAMLALGLHLYHGAWSAFRTLGIGPEDPHPRHRPLTTAVAAVVWLGFTAIPVAVLLGWLR